MFEYDSRQSLYPEAPTTSASATPPIRCRQLSSPSLPAAPTTVMPSEIAPRIARFTVSLCPPPMLMLITAGFT